MLLLRLLLTFLRFLLLLLLLIALRLAAGKSLLQSKLLGFCQMNQFLEALGQEAHVERVLGAIKGRGVEQQGFQSGNVLIVGCASGQRLKLIDRLVEERVVNEDELIPQERHLEPRFEVGDGLLNDLIL